jgi:hypothetical protein
MENYATFHVGRIIANFQNEEREFCVEITMYKDGVKTVARANMSARDFALALTGHLSHVTDATVTTYTRGSYQVGGGGGRRRVVTEVSGSRFSKRFPQPEQR